MYTRHSVARGKRRSSLTGKEKKMRIQLSSVLCALFMALAIPSVQAQELVQVSAVGEYKYSSWRKNEVREAAIREAKVSAFKKYVASLPAAKQRLVRDNMAGIDADLDRFVAETIIQKEKRDKASNTYKVAVMAQISSSALDVFLTENSAAGSMGSGFGSDFGAMFVARVESSRKAFQDKTTSIRETDDSALLDESSVSDGESSVDSTRARSLSVTTSGGSTERKRDKVSYEPSIEISEEVAYSVEEFLVNAGFEPMAIDQLDGVPFLDELVDDMRDSARMPTRIQKMYQSAAIDAGWTFLGLGTVDIGVPESDAARGSVRVPATVAIRVWALDSGRARTVASVRPKVVYGQDRGSASVAETNAYNAAVKFAMDTVVSQLQQKGLY